MTKKKKDENKKILDLKQAKFIMFFSNPQSETYSNAYRSALKAGYSETYAKNILNQSQDWLVIALSEILDNVSKEGLVAKAKKVLDKTLDSSDRKLAQDSAKFILKTEADFSNKHDVTSNGDSIGIPPVALVEYVNGTEEGKDTDSERI